MHSMIFPPLGFKLYFPSASMIFKKCENPQLINSYFQQIFSMVALVKRIQGLLSYDKWGIMNIGVTTINLVGFWCQGQ